MYNYNYKMKVLKRNGSLENVSFDKILNRITALSNHQHFEKLNIDETVIAQKVVNEIYDGVKTTELDELSSQIAISMYSRHPDFKKLASLILPTEKNLSTLTRFFSILYF